MPCEGIVLTIIRLDLDRFGASETRNLIGTLILVLIKSILPRPVLTRFPPQFLENCVYF